MYYISASYRRKILDKLQQKNITYFKGIVLDIGGRDRGKFRKPKDKVERWIFADIEQKHNPDIVLDVADMQAIENESIDTISAMELFEHVEKIEQGLQECYRTLKKNGNMIFSVPFLYAIHADPYDFQRWTLFKWQNELKKIGFEIEHCEIMGRFFYVMCDGCKQFILSLPLGLRHFGYLFFPFFDILLLLDKTKWLTKHKTLGNFHGGYFFIAKK